MKRSTSLLAAFCSSLVAGSLTPVLTQRCPKWWPVMACCVISPARSGGATDVRCLIAAGADPHFYRLTPANRRDISQSKVVLINGYGLTPTLHG